MNRRIPNGTYGGVGGRELGAPSYPIILDFSNQTKNFFLCVPQLHIPGMKGLLKLSLLVSGTE